MRTVSGRRIKLFLSDLDGTLLNPFNRLNPDDVAAIRELRNDGIAFTFATGRSDSMCRCYAEALELDEAIASYNGAVIREGVAGKRVHVAYMDSDDVRRTLDFFLKQGIDFLFYDPESIYYQPGSRKIRDCQAYNHLAEAMGSVPCELRSFDFKEAAGELCSRCVKLYATDNGRAKMTALRRFLRDETRLIGASSRWNNLDINAEGQTKGSAVQMLADYYGIRRDEICVIGDHDNDVEMMKQAGLSIAMGNASEACRAAADLLTASNRTAGVGRAIRQFLLP